MSKMIVPITYKLTDDASSIHRSDGASIPVTESNRDYRRYLEWLEEGNTPDPVRTPEEETEILLRNEVLSLKDDLQKQNVWLFRMLLEMWKAVKAAGVVSNSDIDPEVLAKASNWISKLDRLKEIDE